MEITKDNKISDAIKENFTVLFTLKKYGLNCADCLAKDNDIIEECAKTHHIDLEKFLKDINKHIKK